LLSNNYIKQYGIVIIFLLHFSPIKSQNLFANPSFEAVNNCIEFKADCAPEAWFNIPAANFLVNGRVAPRPVIGNMVLIVPVGNVMANFNKPRFVYTALCCPLIAQQKYTLSFFINTATINFQQLAFFFTEQEPMLLNINQLCTIPSLIITNQNFDGEYKQNWKHVKCEYIAKGNEKFCTISNLSLPDITYNMKDAMNKSGDVLYFIDEIVLQPIVPIPPCATYEENAKKLFDYNYRHTNNLPIFKDTPVIKHLPVFIKDTVVINDVLFDVGKYIIKPKVKNILDSLAAQLAQKSILTIDVNGHTDSTGSIKNNQLLSLARATAIKEYLVQKNGQWADKILAIGKGQNYPVAENTTPEGKQKNRRVEIVITYTNGMR
jgi:outer membrane protein OmpA-like peptidoglycan-associated protein